MLTLASSCSVDISPTSSHRNGGLTFWIALPAVPLIVGAIGMVVERFGLRHVHKFGHVAELIFTFGLAFLLQEFVKLVFGQDTKPYAVPEVLQGTLFTVGDQPFGSYRAFMILVSISIFIGLYLLLTRTRVGMIIQAALTHPNTVSNLGHNVPLIFMAVFGRWYSTGRVGGCYRAADRCSAAWLRRTFGADYLRDHRCWWPRVTERRTGRLDDHRHSHHHV